MTALLLRLWLCALAVPLFTGCSTARFYTQAARGQWEILANRRPVAKLLADPRLDKGLAQRLLLTQEILAFAKNSLGLPADRQYDTYVDLHRDHVVWVVFAAPEFSVEAKRWWYPFLGRLEYRGYFRKEHAVAEVARLRAQGWDVVAGGVDAYSTLGVFRDPLLNTFITDPDNRIAELLFHELTHQEVFLRGDTDFNEAFATATGREGVRRWLRAKGDTAGLREYARQIADEETFADLVLDTRRRLRALYARTENLTAEQRRPLKQAELDRFRRRAEALPVLSKDAHYAPWFRSPVNNARLNTVDSYHSMVPGFERLLAEHDGDLKSYFAAVKAMGGLSKAERRQRLKGGTGE